ncbi:hypothetical protein ACLOJK_037067 [Asimina triloba]
MALIPFGLEWIGLVYNLLTNSVTHGLGDLGGRRLQTTLTRRNQFGKKSVSGLGRNRLGKKSEHAVADTAKLEATTGGGKWRREMAGKEGDGRWRSTDSVWEPWKQPEERNGGEERRWAMVATRWWLGAIDLGWRRRRPCDGGGEERRWEWGVPKCAGRPEAGRGTQEDSSPSP